MNTAPTTSTTASIFSAEHALREAVEQAVQIIDAAKRDNAPLDRWLPVLRRTLRGGLVAADALNGVGDV